MIHESLDTMLLDLFRAQAGVVAAHQVLAIGGTRRQIRYRVNKGQWIPLREGIYQHALFEPSVEMWLFAIAVSGFGHTSHRYGARKHVFEPYDSAPPEVTIRRNSFQHLPSSIIVHESTQMETADIVMINNLPVSGVERTIMDVAAVERRPWAILAAMDSAVRAGKTTPEKLGGCLQLHARRGRDGTVRFRHALEVFNSTGTLPIGHASRRLAALACAASIPYPTFEDRVSVDGRFVAQVDLSWPVPLIAFSDGFTHHASQRRQSSKDKEQRQRLRNGGALVVEFTNDQLSKPGYVTSTLRSAYQDAVIRLRKNPHRYRSWVSHRSLYSG